AGIRLGERKEGYKPRRNAGIRLRERPALMFTVKPIPFPYHAHILKQNHDMEMTLCPHPVKSA
ncbi:hypothetical protein, partial [Paenibacillus sp. VTT E-133291]|uniref:hypothetical protein n=1 Tax=Paenibacillus sp. VTT E-133291 TaxID=1986223 RepID=UPI000BDD1E70